jgi:hypothetical protein
MARISESCRSVLFVVLAISDWPVYGLHFYFMYVSIQALNEATRVFRPLVAQSVDIRKQLKSARLSPI